MAAIDTATPEKWMLIGKNGWLGGMLIELLTKGGKDFVLANSRTQNRESIAAELDEHKPTHVLNASGQTGRPNVDWCETHQAEALRSNVLGSMNVADLCEERGIHHTLYATGCIFEYDAAHPIGGAGFTEEDKAKNGLTGGKISTPGDQLKLSRSFSDWMAGEHTNLRNIVDEGKGKLQWERDIPASALSNLESLASSDFKANLGKIIQIGRAHV